MPAFDHGLYSYSDRGRNSVGTPEYLAPEQIADAESDDGTSMTDTYTDIFALGLIFYEIVRGQKAFSFDDKEESGEAYTNLLLNYFNKRLRKVVVLQATTVDPLFNLSGVGDVDVVPMQLFLEVIDAKRHDR